eukprot:2498988-Rhodomonas_salina.2
MQVKSWTGMQYGGVIIDDTSNDIDLVTVKLKSDFEEEYDRVVRQQGIMPKYLRSDGGGENVSKRFEQRLAKDASRALCSELAKPKWQKRSWDPPCGSPIERDGAARERANSAS